MWTEVRNSSRSLDKPQDHNITQIISPAFSWLPRSSERNGSITTIPPALDEKHVDRTSGIIPVFIRSKHPSAPLLRPGAIAAAVFIGFLLALYSVLWKCMGRQPKRRKRRRSKVCKRSLAKAQEC